MVNILIACTGSVATIKIPEILEKLAKIENVKIKLVVSQNSQHFLPQLSELGIVGETILTDQHEWSSWSDRGDPVLHIELRNWADIAVIAPLSANTLAKLANGLADNLLTSVMRAWDFKKMKPILIAPAMNTMMWEHPVTNQHLETLSNWGYTIVPPISKTLVCGETGMGAMASVESIIDAIRGVVKI